MRPFASYVLPGVEPGGVDKFNPAKRRKVMGLNEAGAAGPTTTDGFSLAADDDPLDPLTSMQVFTIAGTFEEDAVNSFSGYQPWAYQSDFRLDPLSLKMGSFTGDLHITDQTVHLPPSLDGLDPEIYVTLEPSLPDRSTLGVPPSAPNPFMDDAESRIPTIDKLRVFTPRNGEINGYLKVRIHLQGLREEQASPRPLCRQTGKRKRLEEDDEQPLAQSDMEREMVRALAVGKESGFLNNPPNFGLNCKLSLVERKIFRFYTDAWCSGRTILNNTNSWKVDLGPMLPASEPLRYALLCISSTYILDYCVDEQLRSRANAYYRAAVSALTKRMESVKDWSTEKGDDLVGTFVILSMHDVVTWESRRPKGQQARWLEGARAACKILDATDPGHRYYRPLNVQASSARIGNAMNIGRFAIFGLPFTPLDIENTKDKKFGWLLYGTESEVRKIHGATGYCSKLLHIWSQITHLAAQHATKPDLDVTPVLAQVILERIERLVQWSDLSPGYATTEEFFAACTLNEHGKIQNAAEMVDLGGQCWKKAAQIYLLCRLSRYPRTHPAVLEKLDLLLELLIRMPCSGSLFTSMTPLFPCFLMGLLSAEGSRHRQFVQNWFGTVMGANQCRSCLPPTWAGLNRLWAWMDTELLDANGSLPVEIERRDPWWETMVARIMETEGTLCVL